MAASQQLFFTPLNFAYVQSTKFINKEQEIMELDISDDITELAISPNNALTIARKQLPAGISISLANPSQAKAIPTVEQAQESKANGLAPSLNSMGSPEHVLSDHAYGISSPRRDTNINAIKPPGT